MDTALIKDKLMRMGMPENMVTDKMTSFRTGHCTEETEVTKEIKETKETKEIEDIKELQESEELEDLEETDEVNELDTQLSERIDKIISEYTVFRDKDVNRPLFMLARKLRGIEEELKAHFSVSVIAEVVGRWQAINHDSLEENHDYLTEFLDKLSLVRFPEGLLVKALERAKKRPPPKKTARLPRGLQLLASLCRELQWEAGTEPFFLAGRSAAKVLGEPHETVACWMRVLQGPRLKVIELVSKGRLGVASRYRYLADA
jgi:hypothetical protein